MRFVMTFLFIQIARCAVSSIFFFTFFFWGGGKVTDGPPSFENEGAWSPCPPVPMPLALSITCFHLTLFCAGSLGSYRQALCGCTNLRTMSTTVPLVQQISINNPEATKGGGVEVARRYKCFKYFVLVTCRIPNCTRQEAKSSTACVKITQQ